MLQIFRSNQFFIVVPLLMYILVLHAGALTGFVLPAPHPEEGGLLYRSLLGWTANMPRVSALLAVGLVLFQAVYINLLADQFRLLGERNWYPGLFYALAASGMPEFLHVSPPLMAVTFVAPVLWNIFKAYQKPFVFQAIFDAGFYLSVGSLFYAPMLWLGISAFVGIGLVRVFRLKERFLFFTGVMVPQFLTWLWYFWVDKGAEFREVQRTAVLQWYKFDIHPDQTMLLKTGLLVLFGLVFLLGFGGIFNRKSIQIQKYIGVLYWFLIVGALSALFRTEWRWEHLLLPVAPMGILPAMTFQNMRSRFWMEINHLAIFALVLIIQYWGAIARLLGL